MNRKEHLNKSEYEGKVKSSKTDLLLIKKGNNNSTKSIKLLEERIESYKKKISDLNDEKFDLLRAKKEYMLDIEGFTNSIIKTDPSFINQLNSPQKGKSFNLSLFIIFRRIKSGVFLL